MFASQLLRILQTVPSDVKQTSAYDSAEQGMKMKENQNGPLSHDSRSFGREADPLAFQSKEAYLLNECWNPKFVDDLSTGNQNGSNLVENDNNLFTDKIALECGTPESIVCYKEINYHVVKDICVDDGMHVNNKISIDNCKDDADRHRKAVDTEVLLSRGLATENSKGVGVNEHESKEDIDGTLLLQESVDKDFKPEALMQKDETNSGAAKPESFVDKALPLQEFGTRSFLRSFLNSLDSEENSVIQPSDQDSSGKVVSSSEEAGATEDVQPSSISYNSKVETESIMFNFNHKEGDTNETKTENVIEPSLDSRDVTNHNDATDADNLQLHSDITSENAHDNKEKNHVEHCSNSPLQFENSKSVNSINNAGKDVSSHEHRDPNNDSVLSLRRYDEGESSFGAGHDTFSGAITYSGNLSLQSDGSARSFAFPVLQGEWISSPVRMSKADGRHFRKRKGWRSGLLCCRF